MVARGASQWIRRLLRIMRSLDTEGPVSKTLASAACRVESRTRRSGGMADAADSKSVGRKAVWVRLPPPAPSFLRRLQNHLKYMRPCRDRARGPNVGGGSAAADKPRERGSHESHSHRSVGGLLGHAYSRSRPDSNGQERQGRSRSHRVPKPLYRSRRK